MTRNVVRTCLVLGCLVSLSLLHLMWPAEASQPASLETKVLDSFVARNIGPANMGGRVVKISGVDNNPKIIYVATASGGLWKTTDGGDHWEGLFDHESSVCIGDVQVSQSNPNIVWIGTGEHNARNSVAWGDGIYKSTDGGKTWQNMGLNDSHSTGRIAIHPTNPDIVYVGVLGHLWGPNKERGIFKTTNGGKTWEVSKFLDENTGFIDLQMDPSDPDILYGAAYCVRRDAFSKGDPATKIGPLAGLYKTSDGGKNWEKMTNGLPKNGIGRCGLDIYRKDPNVVYAVVQTDKTPVSDSNTGGVANGPGGPEVGGIFRSDDKGKTWKHLNTLCPRPFYFGQIRVDPNDDKRIYVHGVNVSISNDGGKTFGGKGGKGEDDPDAGGGGGGEPFDPGQQNKGDQKKDDQKKNDQKKDDQKKDEPKKDEAKGGMGGGGGKGGGVHSDWHAMWINPKDSNIVWVGSDGGIYLSKNRGASYTAIRCAALGQFYGISVDMSKPYYVYGGLQDNGSHGGPSATRDPAGIRQNTWFTIGGGDGFHTQCDPDDPNTVYTESQNGALSRVNVAGKGGKGGGAGGGGGKGGGMGGGVSAKGLGHFNWSTPMLLSPHDSKVFYYGSNFLLRSTNRGEGLKKISPDLTYGSPNAKGSPHTLFTIGESPKKKGVLWTGADDGRIHVSKDDGQNWTDVSKIADMPKDSCISRVEPSHFDAGTCYVSLTRYRNDDRKPYIFKTTDYGESWTSVSSNLPESGSVHVVIESSKNKQLLFCGTEFGLFASLDGGGSWRQMKGGLPTVAVHDIIIHPRDRDLVIGTHGRSIYVMDDISPLEQLTPEVLARPAHLFPIRPATAFKWKAPGTPPKSNEFVGQNPPYGAMIRYHLKSAQAQPVSVLILDTLTGKQLTTIKGGTQVGLHQVVWNLRSDGQKETTVPPGEYLAVLQLADHKQYRMIRVDAE